MMLDKLNPCAGIQDTMAEDATQASADGSLPALMPLFIFGFDVLSKYRINESMQA